MEKEIGPEKTKALAKYIGAVAITRSIATEIVESLWGDAPAIEKTKCILLCQTYQLNPLMKHIYLIGYKRKVNGKVVVDQAGKPILDWSIQQGIGATRLLAQRKHNYSYMDMTPRKATTVEIEKILGDTADKECIYGFCHVKDMDTGAEAYGLRGWSKNDPVKGAEKGNTQLNMACVRAERLALDRQYPGEMPDIEVFDERYIAEETGTVKVDTSTGEIIDSTARVLPDAEPEPESQPEHWCEEHGRAYEKKTRGSSTWYAHKLPDGSWCNEIKKKAAEPPTEPTQDSRAEAWENEPEPEEASEELEETAKLAGWIDIGWLKESLDTLRAKKLQSWTESKLLEYMKTTYKLEAATVLEAVAKLDKGQATHFVKKVQDTLDMA